MASIVMENCFTQKLIEDVQSTFKRIETALKTRETQLLRQIDVLLQQYTLNKNNNAKCFNKINVVFNNEVDILKAVSNFGIIDFEGINLENNIYQIEEYENPNCDHMCMHKCLKKINNAPDIIPNKSEDQTESTEKTDIKVSSELIVENLQLYALNLKSKQSNIDLQTLTTNMELRISEPLSSTSNNITENLNNSEDISFEFYESSNSDCSKISELNDCSNLSILTNSSSDKMNISSDNLSDDRPNIDSKMNQDVPIIRVDGCGNVHNRNDNRFTKISTTNLEDVFNKNYNENSINSKTSNECDNSFNSKECLVECNSDSTLEMRANSIQNNENDIKNNKSNMNLEHPIQQWMQQISREPEIEPIQNNELMEHVNITTTL